MTTRPTKRTRDGPKGKVTVLYDTDPPPSVSMADVLARIAASYTLYDEDGNPKENDENAVP